LKEKMAASVYKTEIMAVGILRAEHATTPYEKVGTNFADKRRSLDRYRFPDPSTSTHHFLPRPSTVRKFRARNATTPLLSSKFVVFRAQANLQSFTTAN
jgi:hypothetical protein